MRLSRALMLTAILLIGAGCVRTQERATVAIPYMGDVRVEIARTAEAIERGLSYREDIGDGMLFCFGSSAPQFFWMYEMRTPLDAIWVNDGFVTATQQDIPVRDEAGDWTRFRSGSPADALLELPTGTLENVTLTTGTEILDVQRKCRGEEKPPR